MINPYPDCPCGATLTHAACLNASFDVVQAEFELREAKARAFDAYLQGRAKTPVREEVIPLANKPKKKTGKKKAGSKMSPK